MSMLTWAEKEIEIACARERAASEDRTDWEYGIACYESALKTFKCLLEDEHSGFSIGVTQNFLNRLIDGKPLTPIEDTPDIWNAVDWYDNGEPSMYQCSRMHSLFKYVHWDGRVTFSDVDRVVVTSIETPTISWQIGNATRLIDEMFPITLPYWPPKGRYRLFTNEFLVDPKNGDYDTVGYIYAVNPAGERVEINRYFKEDDVTHKFVEIDFEEYCNRMKAAHDLEPKPLKREDI